MNAVRCVCVYGSVPERDKPWLLFCLWNSDTLVLLLLYSEPHTVHHWWKSPADGRTCAQNPNRPQSGKVKPYRSSTKTHRYHTWSMNLGFCKLVSHVKVSTWNRSVSEGRRAEETGALVVSGLCVFHSTACCRCECPSVYWAPGNQHCGTTHTGSPHSPAPCCPILSIKALKIKMVLCVRWGWLHKNNNQ